MKSSILRLRYNIEWHHSEYINNTNGFKRYPFEKDINIPPPIENQEIRRKLSLLINQLRQISTEASNYSYKCNLSNEERNTLKELKNKNLVYIPSDKGGEMCCLTTEQYERAARNHLQSNTYSEINSITVETLERKINKTWKEVCKMANIPKFIEKEYTVHNSKNSNVLLSSKNTQK